MKRRPILCALLSASLFLTLLAGSTSAANYTVVGMEQGKDPNAVAKGIAAGQKVPNQYIIVLRDDVTDPGAAAKDIAQKHGLALGLVYKHALKGFSAMIPPAALDKVKSDPRVSFVEQDQLVQAFLHTNDFETLTTGINRIDADLNLRTDVSGVGIAIIDTGIWLTHVDLNAKAGKNCINQVASPNDDNGHGTHVAGIAAAKTKDDKGVRGVAPNAVLYAVKVLDQNGSGFMSWVICGVDWVTENVAVKKIKVANMSLGGSGSDDGNCGNTNNDSLHKAICNSVANGVVYVVAAGNSNKDAKGTVPAAYDEVITVSGMGDSDGKCGRQGPSTSDGRDDTRYKKSNWGSDVDIAAPAVDITSTWKDGLYATATGTSMAAPHVAGAAAQYIASNPGKSPTEVQNALIDAGIPQTQACGNLNNGAGGFTGDRDGFPERLVYAATL